MRLIDADALKDRIKIDDMPALTEGLKSWIDHQPTIDAVPIVRCKDCKHNYSKWGYNPEDIVCDYWETDGLYDDDFCSHGAKVKDRTNYD